MDGLAGLAGSGSRGIMVCRTSGLRGIVMRGASGLRDIVMRRNTGLGASVVGSFGRAMMGG